MCQSSTARLGIGTQGSKISCSGGSDILTHHQRNTQIDRKHSRRTEQDGNGHHRSRTLYDAGNKRTYQKEDDNGEMTLRIEGTEEVDNCRIMPRSRALPALLNRTSEKKRKAIPKRKSPKYRRFLLYISIMPRKNAGKPRWLNLHYNPAT